MKMNVNNGKKLQIGSRAKKGFQKGHKIWKGRSHSLKTRKKMSLSSLGKKGTRGMLGKKHNEATKTKISKTRKLRGHKPTGGFKKGNKPWNAGKTLSLEYRKKLSDSHKGKKPWNWTEAGQKEYNKIRKGIEWRLWREAVFARDGWTCQKCGKNGGLHPHHILNFSQHKELRFAIDNGITLCSKCHMFFHKSYGFTNNNQEQLLEFLIFSE